MYEFDRSMFAFGEAIRFFIDTVVHLPRRINQGLKKEKEDEWLPGNTTASISPPSRLLWSGVP